MRFLILDEFFAQNLIVILILEQSHLIEILNEKNKFVYAAPPQIHTH